MGARGYRPNDVGGGDDSNQAEESHGGVALVSAAGLIGNHSIDSHDVVPALLQECGRGVYINVNTTLGTGNKAKALG